MPPELLAFSESNQLSLGSIPPDASPHSLIYASNNSLFSTDFHDREPPIFQNVVALEEKVSNGIAAVPDPIKSQRVWRNSLIICTKEDQADVVSRVECGAAAEDDSLAGAVESLRSSFSLAVKEFQNRRSDSLPKISDGHMQASSLDFNNNVTAYSPRLGVIKNKSVLNHCSGALTSPGTPNYLYTTGALQKGWSSERVPLPQNGNKRQVGGAHLSFNNGKTLPSKWEDAERWIFRPVNTDTGFQQSGPPSQSQRCPRSKSGPLGPSGVAYHSSYSPAVQMFDGIHGGNFLAESPSPFSSAIMAGDSFQTGYGYNMGCPANNEPGITRSVSIHGCTAESLNQLSLPHSPRIGEEFNGVKDVDSDISRAVSRRDMATQMSPEGSPCSFSRRKHSTSSASSTTEMRNSHSPRLDVRDVEVDDRVTMTRRSRKNKSPVSVRGTENADDWTRKAAEAHSTDWEVTETRKSISKVRKEEARIAAWENLQKANAEAALRKLEMKLEKKRSSSLDKIMNKLRLAQKKGQEMRRAVLANHAQHVSNSSNKTILVRSTRPMSSLSGCFKCHIF